MTQSSNVNILRLNYITYHIYLCQRLFILKQNLLYMKWLGCRITKLAHEMHQKWFDHKKGDWSKKEF